MNTFSDRSLKMTIATGLFIGTLGVCFSLQGISSLTRRHAGSGLGVQSLIGSTVRHSLNWTAAPVSAKFTPIPNPEPAGTGGTGTR